MMEETRIIILLKASLGWMELRMQEERKLGVGYDIVYSRKEKIIFSLVIGFFYGSVSLKGRRMKADKE